MEDIIFRKKYVNYNQISNVTLMEINDFLISHEVYVALGDDFSNDWAGYCYYFCKSLDKLDDYAISSFTYIITWFMTSNPISFPFKNNNYYKNEKIMSECLKIYENLISDYDSEVDLCKKLFKEIYGFYLNDVDKYLKKTERMNCILTYKDMLLFEKIPCDSRSDKMKILIDYYYNNH